VSCTAQEHDENMQDVYQAFISANFHAEQLIFVNESRVNQNATRNFLLGHILVLMRVVMISLCVAKGQLIYYINYTLLKAFN